MPCLVVSEEKTVKVGNVKYGKKIYQDPYLKHLSIDLFDNFTINPSYRAEQFYYLSDFKLTPTVFELFAVFCFLPAFFKVGYKRLFSIRLTHDIIGYCLFLEYVSVVCTLKKDTLTIIFYIRKSNQWNQDFIGN